MTNRKDYWKECISVAAEECNLNLTPEQLECLTEGVESGHEHYGMAFYSPPSSDRLSEIEREYKTKLKELQKEHDKYVCNAECAIKQALGVHRDTIVTINNYGEVFQHCGRTTQIQ